MPYSLVQQCGSPQKKILWAQMAPGPDGFVSHRRDVTHRR